MTVGNWARWGPDDERGAANLVDAAAIGRAVASVHMRRSIGLGLPIRSGHGPCADLRPKPWHAMIRDGGDYAAGLPERPGYGYADDTLTLACHGTTHLDALSHVWRDGLMWNGHPSTTVTSRGAARCGIEKTGPLVTRAHLLDFAADPATAPADGEPIGADRLAAAAERAGVRPEPGDALLVRTGWLAAWRDGRMTERTWPGLDHDCADWLGDNDVALVGADNIAVEVGPSTVEGSAMPLHLALLRDRGVYLLELLDLEELAAAGATTFMLVVAPLTIVGGVGSPVAPTAIL